MKLAKIARRHHAKQSDIRAVPAESLFMREMGGGVLEVLSIVNGSVTRLGRIHCGSAHEALVRERKPSLRINSAVSEGRSND